MTYHLSLPKGWPGKRISLVYGGTFFFPEKAVRKESNCNFQEISYVVVLSFIENCRYLSGVTQVLV